MNKLITCTSSTHYVTNCMMFDFTFPANMDSVVYSSLFTELINKASPKFPSKIKLFDKLDDLYGAYLSASTFQCGNLVIARVIFTFLKEDVLDQEGPLLEESLQFINDVIFNNIKTKFSTFSDSQIYTELKRMKSYQLSMEEDLHYYMAKTINKIQYDNGQKNLLSIYNMDLLDIANKNAADIKNKLSDLFLNAGLQIYCNDSALLGFKRHIPKKYLYNKIPKLSVKQEKSIEKNNRIIWGNQKENLFSQKLICKKFDYVTTDKFMLAIVNVILGYGSDSLLFKYFRQNLSLSYYAYSTLDYYLGDITIYISLHGKIQQHFILNSIKHVIQLLSKHASFFLSEGKKKLIFSINNPHHSQANELNTLFKEKMFMQKASPKKDIKAINSIGVNDFKTFLNRITIASSLLLLGE